jgi:signal transduction histidine kinase
MIFVASKAISPIHQLIQSASQINYANINSRLPIPENEDEIHQLAKTINDLLSRLESSFYQQKQFTSDASHEMQTPLAGIKGIIEVLLRKPRTPERYEEKMREVLVQTNRLSQLHDQLLQLARLESSVLIAKKEQVYVAAIIKKCLISHDTLIKNNSIQIQNNVPLELFVWVDSIQFEMIVDNLISNAIKYNKEGGSILIDWNTTKKTLSIADEGIGIDADQLPLLFNRFFRADDSRSSQIPGIGLGLSIVKRLCEVQNIQLSVSSIKSKGSSFILQFPS